MQRIRVLFILPSLRRAGAQTQTLDLLNALDPKKFHLCLFTYGSHLDQLDRIDRSQICFYHRRRCRKVDVPVIREISRIIDEEQIDIVHSTLHFSYVLGWLAIKLSSRTPALVAAIHNTRNISLKQELQDRLLHQWILRCCKRVIFVCHAQKTFWESKYSFLKKKANSIYNGIDTDYWLPFQRQSKRNGLRKELAIPEDAFVACCVAGFRKEKGHQYLIEAFSRVKHQNAYLLLAGEGAFLPEMKRLVEKKGLSRQIIFLGNLDDVRPVFGASDISVLASVAVEAFSISMLESMSMEIPVITSDIGGLREAVIPGETGILVKPGDVSMLAQAIGSVAEQPEWLHRMGKQARSLVGERFTIQTMATEMEKLLSDVFKGSDMV